MRTAPISSAPILLLTAWLPTVLAGISGELTYGSCQLAFAYITFDDQVPVPLKNPNKLRDKCQNLLQIESLYLCLKTHGQGTDAWHEPLEADNATCRQYLDSPLPPLSIVDRYSDEDIDALKHFTLEDKDAHAVFREVVLPTEKLYHDAFATLDATDYVYYHHYAYGVAVIIFWIGIVSIGMLSRFLWAIASSQRYSPYASKPLGVFDTCALWLKRYITVPATFGYRCSQNLGWCTIPPRLQSLTLLAFLLLNTFFCIHGYRFIEDNLYFPTIERQAWRYLSDRTGVIAFANFPVIWLFGMRNNVLAWVTGWDFGMYNNFHRWVARIATLQAVIHSVGYTVLILIEGGWGYYWSWWERAWWCGGIAATVFMCLILPFSVYWMRRKRYELFLVLHIALSVLLLIAMLFHVWIFKKRWDLLAWIPFGFWGLDRVLRMSRTLAFNARFWDTWATATYDVSSNMVRLSVPQTSSWYDPAPGTFYYVHVLSDPRFWESHPFTMAYSTGHRRRASKDSTEDTPLMQQEDDISLANHPDEAPSMMFLIRPYDDFTSRLKSAATAPWPSPASLRVLVEGPYGHTQPFDDFENVLFVVGGSGIAVPLAYMHALIASSRTRSVRVVWAAREVGLAADVVAQDVGALLDSRKLALRVCITHREGPGLTGLPEGVDARFGRPDVADEVADAVAAAGGGSLAVVACGPARMADDARLAVVEHLGKGSSRVEYFEESFKW